MSLLFNKKISQIKSVGTLILFATVTPLLAFGQDAAAQHAGDVFINIQADKIHTGLVEDDEVVEANVRVFESEFGESGVPGYSDEPGWEAFPGTFESGSRLGWNALEGVRRWNGAGFDTGIEETIEVTFASLSFTIGNAPVSGFDLAVAGDGSFHRHIGFYLDSPTNDPAVGVYLVELELHALGAYETSDSFWIVFNNEASEEEHEAAAEWVEENMANELRCTGDLTGDNVVDLADFSEFLIQFGNVGSGLSADLDEDQDVDVNDFSEFLVNFGNTCEERSTVVETAPTKVSPKKNSRGGILESVK